MKRIKKRARSHTPSPYVQAERFPPGTVVVIGQELSRFADFSISLANLILPPGTALVWAKGCDIVFNLNRGLSQATGSWVFILGDDHSFAPDTLLRLLRHRVDVVSALCLNRQPPYHPVLFKGMTDEGYFLGYGLDELPKEGGLIEAFGISGAGILVSRNALDKVGQPYFECGQYDRTILSEDLHFQQKLRYAGFTLYCDLDTPIEHITPMSLYPVRTEDGWQTIIAPPLLWNKQNAPA